MRISILVRGEEQERINSLPVKIKDLSTELEKITVRVIRLRAARAQAAIQQVVTKLPSTIQHKSPHVPLPIAAPQESVKAVEITIALPKLGSFFSHFQPRKSLRRMPKRMRAAGGALGAAAIVSVSGYYALAVHHVVPAASGPSSSGAPTLVHGSPTYQTIVPNTKHVDDMGGWTRISPPDRDPVYTYVDKIGNVQLNVSEQPLPANFRTNTADKIAQLAQGFSATDRFMAGNTPIYVGTSAKGPQSVILAKDDLLILIKSTAPLLGSQWVSYINGLH